VGVRTGSNTSYAERGGCRAADIGSRLGQGGQDREEGGGEKDTRKAERPTETAFLEKKKSGEKAGWLLVAMRSPAKETRSAWQSHKYENNVADLSKIQKQ